MLKPNCDIKALTSILEMAEAGVYVMNLDKATYCAHTQPLQSHINVGFGNDITIRQLVETIRQVMGYQGQIEFYPSKPDGTPRKLMDNSRLNALGKQARVKLADGLAKDYADYVDKHID